MARRRALFCAAVAALAVPAAHGSALLASTPACELLSDAEASAIVGVAMVRQGGTADPGLSDCIWDGPNVRISFSLSEAALYAPSGRTASDEFDWMIEVTTKAGHPPELISGVGERAALHRSEDPEAWFLTMVAGGDYLSVTLTGATRDGVIALGKAAAPRM